MEGTSSEGFQAALVLGFTLFHDLFREASHRSCPLCNPIQNWAEFPK
jgi:hypothetical protein